MKRLVAVLALSLVPAAAFAEETASDEYARALDKENTDRDVSAAIELYKGIVKKHKDEDEVAAKAQLKIGECWEKLGVTRDAKEAYEAVVRDFPGQAAIVDKANERLAALAGAPVKDDPVARVNKILNGKKIDLDFQETPITDIMDFMTEFSGVPMVADPEMGDAATKATSFAVKNLTLRKVMDLLADTMHVAWTNWNGIVVWSTADRIAALKQLPALAAGENAADEDRKIQRSLEAIKISLNFTQTPVEETMSFIREVSELNIVLDQDLPKDITFTFKINEARLTDVMTLLAFEKGLEITIANGALVVKKK